MPLSEFTLLTVSAKQYSYKLKAYAGLFNKLIITQILVSLLLAFAGFSQMSSFGFDTLSVSFLLYSGDMVIACSFIYIASTAIFLTTKSYKRNELPLILNKTAGALSDAGFLLTIGVFAGITSSLAGNLLRVIVYFTSDLPRVFVEGFYLSASELLLGLVAAILYMLLFAALGYFIGIITQISAAFIFILPVTFWGTMNYYPEFSQALFNYFTAETSLPLFILKITVLVILLFGASLLGANRMEVGK